MFSKIVNKEPIFIKPIQSKKDRLFETIKTQNNTIYNIKYHQARVNQAYKKHFNSTAKFELSSILKATANLNKIKVIYDKNGICDIAYTPYKPKKIEKLMLIDISGFEYNYKYLDRAMFEHIYSMYKDIDEFILLNNGYITDTTISNIALYNEKMQQWHSPTKTLLNGTYREKLIDEKKLKLTQIDYTNLKNYSKIALLNAMVGFRVL